MQGLKTSTPWTAAANGIDFYWVSLLARASAQSPVYSPVEMPETREINDVLSEEDIPTGSGGFRPGLYRLPGGWRSGRH